jgi:hypothetical protein
MLRPEFSSRRHVRHHPENHGASAHAHRRNTIAAFSIIALLAAWAGAATLYILFHDDALKIIVERQIAITRTYETQVGQLEAEIDRLRSLKLIDQERVDRAVADLVRRQTVIETRQAAIKALAPAKPGSREAEPETTGTVQSTPGATKPSPLSGTILIAPPAERWGRLESRPLPPLAMRPSIDAASSTMDARIVNLGRELALLEAAQSRSLNEIEERYDAHESRLRKVLIDLHLKTARNPAPAIQASMGGPFLPWTRVADDPFTRQLHRIRTAARSIDSLEREVVSVPVRRPTAGEADVTSTFGMRVDPFVRQLAMHTGVDFRGETGDPVRATASGKVVQAERNGGYGLMVEVDHGNGYATRYAHLSAINVAAGESVSPGAIVGRIGSTGRSTGPHLHYEVRFNGDPIDPQRFLRAGLRLEY